jgi:hypothetical protein
VPVPALCLLLMLSACSGDDGDDGDDDKPGDGSSSAASDNGEGDEGEAGEGEAGEDEPVGDVQRVCEAQVDVTGAVEASWEGDATVRLTSDGERAVYEAINEDSRLAIYSAGGDFDTASANFTQADQTFTTPMGDKAGLKAKVNGKSASADAEAAGIAGDTVQIQASFTCGRTRVE